VGRGRQIFTGIKRIAAGLVVGLTAVAAQAQEVDLLIPESAIDSLKAVCVTAKNEATSVDTLARDFQVAPGNISNLNPDPDLVTADILVDQYHFRVSVRLPGTTSQRTSLEAITAGDQMIQLSFLLQAGPDCALNLTRAVVFDEDGLPASLVHMTGDPPSIESREPLNPGVPSDRDPGGVAVAHVDSGVNYLLPQIASRLARDEQGILLGRDMFDDDQLPFDFDPGSSPLTPRRHGTGVARLLLSEAPAARLIPYRHPGRDYGAFEDLVEDIAEGPARIVAMPLGGYRKSDWDRLGAAIAAHPELLFVVSAGNDGRDIDAEPVYPASFGHDNLLVVTSVDTFGALAIESNWGSFSVDIAVPAEQIETIDYRGALVRASGASYAVPRVAALAARFSATNPTWSTRDIKDAIIGLTSPLPQPGGDRIRYGWIVNPALVGPNPPLR
jgi:Subtilase family